MYIVHTSFLQTVLPGANHEFQKLASKVFAVIVQQELVSVHIYVTSCLPSVLQQLESRDTSKRSLISVFNYCFALYALLGTQTLQYFAANNKNRIIIIQCIQYSPKMYVHVHIIELSSCPL